MEKINREEARVIAKMNDLYLVINTPAGEKYDGMTLGKILDNKGVHKSGWMPLMTITRDGGWEIIDEPYSKVFPEEKRTAVDGVLGFAVGDALGVPVEFMDRDEVRKVHLTEMIGKETPRDFYSRWGDLIPSGAWSDDTSMLIAGMDSLSENKAQANYDDIMKRYLSWWHNGAYTSLDVPFGLGGCVAKAMENYLHGVPALDAGASKLEENGNGSLMRIFPFAWYCIENDLSEEDTCKYISDASRITHAHEISQMSCFIYTEFLRELMETKNPLMALEHVRSIDYLQYFERDTVLAHKQLLNPSFNKIKDDKIKASGYVVDTLESAIYSIINSHNYEESTLTAINMGYDTDTVAGVTGSLAGMLYGKEDIPQRWLDKLRKKDFLEALARKFEKALQENKVEKKNSLEK